MITGKWWFNSKVDSTGVLLYDLEASDSFARNVADVHHDVVNALSAEAIADAGGGYHLRMNAILCTV